MSLFWIHDHLNLGHVFWSTWYVELDHDHVWLIVAVMEDTRLCTLSVEDQRVCASSTRGSAPFTGAGCFLISDLDSEKVSFLEIVKFI